MKINIILVAVSSIIAACGPRPTENAKMPGAEADSSDVIILTKTQYNAAHITLGKIEQKAIGSSIQVSGRLDVPPENMMTISAPMGGVVKYTTLLPGVKVRKGDVLAILENQEYIQLQQDYLDNESKLEFLEAEYKRQAELSKENVNALKSLQQAKSQFESSKAMARGLEAKLSMINITPGSLKEGKITSTINLYAPINGFISKVNINVGQYVNATDALFKIVNVEHIHAELQVYEKDINQIEIGQQVTFQVSNDNTVYKAAVFLIGKEISPERTVGIHCHLDNEAVNLLPGMFVTARVSSSPHNSDVVPDSAIVNFQGQNYVFAASGNQQFKAIPILIGNTVSKFTEVHFAMNVDRKMDIVISGAGDLIGMLKNKPE